MSHHICFVVHQNPGDGEVIVMVTENDEKVEQQLLAMTVNDLARVVQPEEDDVKHQRNVDRPGVDVTNSFFLSLPLKKRLK
jgi:hypothetical protein